MKTIIGIFGLIQVHVEGGVLGIRKFVGITQCFESGLCGKFYIISGIIILLYFSFAVLLVISSEPGDDKKQGILTMIGLFLMLCAFSSLIIISKISIIFFLLLLGGATILWAAVQYDKKTESKKRSTKSFREYSCCFSYHQTQRTAILSLARGPLFKSTSMVGF